MSFYCLRRFQVRDRWCTCMILKGHKGLCRGPENQPTVDLLGKDYRQRGKS